MPLIKRLSILILFFFLMGSSKYWYETVDKNGNKVFTDKPPTTQPYVKKNHNNLSTFDWEKISKPGTSTLTGKKPTVNKKKSAEKAKKKQQCEKLSRTMLKLRAKLKLRNPARQFDRIKKQLAEIRDKYYSIC